MAEIRRMIRCSNCGNEAGVNISSDLDMNELQIAGRCVQCGNSMQITYNIVEKEQKEQAVASTPPSEEVVDLEQSLRVSDLPSDTLRDIMEE